MPKVYFDVGANAGTNSLHMAGDPDWVVYAFEPTPKLFMELKARTDAFDNYHLFPLAVSNKPGILEFNIAGQGDWGTSSLLNFSDDIGTTWWGRSDLAVTEKVYVTVITLRDFVIQHNIERIDHLQSDVQGLDLEVLMGLGDKIGIVQAGMLETARDHSVKLYKEQDNTLHETVLFLYQNGFVIDDLFYNDQYGHLPQADADLYKANEINVVYRLKS